MRRVYFGGSFDPPHRGHHEMLLRLVRDPLVDFVHVVPTGQNPLKVATESGGERRRAWIDGWLSELRREEPLATIKVLCELVEFDAPPGRPQYTIDTLGLLRSSHSPTDRWVLAVGTDLLPQLSRWKDAEKLLASLEGLWIFPRGRISAEAALALIPEALRPLCTQRWMVHEIPEISSTQIRNSDALQNTASLLAPGVLRVL